MTKDRIKEFSLEQTEPTWLTDVRLKAFDKIAELDFPVVERVKFHRWNLGDGSLAVNEAIGAVPDFTSLGDNPKLVQVGSQTVLEQLPIELVEQGVVFTDFASAMDVIPDIIETVSYTHLRAHETS